MATKTDKKNAIRQDIIDSAGVYSQNLAGKAFLYVYGEEFFEVSFPVDYFLHLNMLRYCRLIEGCCQKVSLFTILRLLITIPIL